MQDHVIIRRAIDLVAAFIFVARPTARKVQPPPYLIVPSDSTPYADSLGCDQSPIFTRAARVFSTHPMSMSDRGCGWDPLRASGVAPALGPPRAVHASLSLRAEGWPNCAVPNED